MAGKMSNNRERNHLKKTNHQMVKMVKIESDHIMGWTTKPHHPCWCIVLAIYCVCAAYKLFIPIVVNVVLLILLFCIV